MNLSLCQGLPKGILTESYKVKKGQAIAVVIVAIFFLKSLYKDFFFMQAFPEMYLWEEITVMAA